MQAAAHKGLHHTVAATPAPLDTAGFAAVGAAEAEPAIVDACKAAGRRVFGHTHYSPVAAVQCTGCSYWLAGLRSGVVAWGMLGRRLARCCCEGHP